MLKKKKENKRKNISIPKGMRDKRHTKEHEEKKRKRPKRNKDSPYFQIKGFIKKRERVMIQRSTKNI
jgi:hypothetical protein